MKKMWKLNNKAVSPVIATILMVAITVVLAAVLYVMVMGFGGETNQAPTASLNPSGNRLVISISDPQTIDPDSSLQINVTGAVGVKPIAVGNIGNVTYVDATADGKVSTGDYFVLTDTADDAHVKLIWVSGGTNTILAEGDL